MTEKEKIRFIEYLRLNTRLRNASLNGALLMFEGRCSDARTIASVCIFNDTGYYVDELKSSPEGDSDIILVSLGREEDNFQ